MSDAPFPLDLKNPWMNAAGSLGFVLDPRHPPVFGGLGAFVTNPISARARRASAPPRQMEFPGGMLMHSGHPNPGLRSALKRYAAGWARAGVPVIVHLLADNGTDLLKSVLQLEGLENVTAIEIGVPADASAGLTSDLVQAAQGELPCICQLPATRAIELAEAAMAAGAAAISLGPPRGTLPGPDGRLVSGRLYGPALYPQALEAVRNLAQLGVTVIASGGIDSQAKGEVMLEAGALAVQIDIGLWKGMD